MREMTIYRLENINEEEKKNKPQVFRNALLDTIDEMENLKDTVISWEWDPGISEEERKKFNWEQKIKIFNEVFAEKDILFQPDDKVTFRFFEQNVEETYTPKTEEVNGYTYKGKQIIKRTAKKNFKLLPNKTTTEFLSDYASLGGENAYTQIANEVGIFADNETIREVAEDYIMNLRERQKEIVNNAGEAGEFFEMVEFNEINEDIEKIVNNKKFKIRAKIWAKSFGSSIKRILSYLKRTLKRHWLGLASLFATIIGTIVGTIYYQKSLQAIGQKMKNIAENLHNNLTKLKQDIEKYLGEGIFSHLPDIVIGIIGFILTWTGKLSITSGKIIFTPLRYISLYSAACLTVILGGVNWFFVEEIQYFAMEIAEYSYLLSGKYPPKNSNISSYLAGEENMTEEEYRKKYYTPDKLHHSYIAKILSYPLYISATIAQGGSKGVNLVLRFLINNIKYILLVLATFLLMYIIIKWRVT